MSFRKGSMLVSAVGIVAATLMTSGCGGEEAGQEAADIIQKAKTQTVQVGDIQMAYKELGEGEPLVLIMGYGASMELWDPGLVRDLSGTYKVIVFDNRGIGGTASGSAAFTIEQFAQDTAGLITALNLPKPKILAWSMGTNIAQELAIAHPDLVDMLVLYASDVGPQKMVPPSDNVLKTLEDQSGTPGERGKRLTDLLFPQDWTDAHPDYFALMPRPTENIDGESVGKQAQAIGQWQGSYDRLSGITCPTLLVTGTEDSLVPPENTTMMAGLMPEAWVARFAGGGHGLMYQFPDRLAATVLNFFENCAR